MRREDAYFEMALEENQEWLSRMGTALDFRDRCVLDVGCGHGALSVKAAEWGARSVVGIDLDADRIHFARRNLESSYARYRDQVEFLDLDIREVKNRFDLIISKDTFEHVDDLSMMLDNIWRLLLPGGTLAIGFSPLYYSPNGDHGRWQLPLPWIHAILPESYLAKRLSIIKGRPITGATHLGLNRITPENFRKLFNKYPWSELQVLYNRGRKPGLLLFSALRSLRPLEKYFTISIYAVARKGAGSDPLPVL